MNSTGFRPGFSSAPQSNRQTSPYPSFTQSPSSTPFLFHTSSVSPPPPNLFWKPPATDTTSRAGPMASPSQEVADVSMEDPSSSLLTSKIKPKEEPVLGTARERPSKEEREEERLPLVPTRRVSTNAVSRIYRERYKARNKATGRQRRPLEEENDDSESEDELVASRQGVESITANHHYTFNMPSVPANRSEVPYMLLGYVFVPSLVDKTYHFEW